MIIGIDHGNRNRKLQIRYFSSNPAFAGKAGQPGAHSGIPEPVFIMWEGKCRKRSAWIRQRMKIIIFLPLQHWRREMRCRSLTDASVKMGAALPPRRFQQQKESFKKYLLKTKDCISSEGTVDFKNLYLGNYFVKEIEPAEGYLLDETEYPVEVSYEGQEVQIVHREVTDKGN